MRLLFLYAFEPSGHGSAAAALEQAARQAGHETRLLAVSSHYHPFLGRFLAGVYLRVIRWIPGLWGFLYDNPSVAGWVAGLRRAYLFFGARRMRRTLEELNPHVAICTHAVPMSFLIDSGAGGRKRPFAAVLTDFGVHGYWLKPRADLYFTASGEAAELARDRGVKAEQVEALGIPIHPVFAQSVDRVALRRVLGAGERTRVLLLSGGSRGLGHLPEIAGALLEKLSDVLLLAVCGSNAELRSRLAAVYAGDRRLRALGYQTPEQMRDLLGACDLLIGKAGGVSVAEALAMGAPMLLVDPIPGQEERNAAYLEAKGAALRAGRLEALGGQVKTLLDDAGKMQFMRAAALGLGRPEAARRIIAAIENRFAARVA